MTINELLVLLEQRRKLLEQENTRLTEDSGVWSSAWNENYGRWSEIIHVIGLVGGLDADTFLRFGLTEE